eukprot:m.183660 g.183660  ORF g.183660 m.183660 type:complete len:917 (+) comp15901_c0_seq1:414-3164(+)
MAWLLRRSKDKDGKTGKKKKQGKAASLPFGAHMGEDGEQNEPPSPSRRSATLPASAANALSPGRRSAPTSASRAGSASTPDATSPNRQSQQQQRGRAQTAASPSSGSTSSAQSSAQVGAGGVSGTSDGRGLSAGSTSSSERARTPRSPRSAAELRSPAPPVPSEGEGDEPVAAPGGGGGVRRSEGGGGISTSRTASGANKGSLPSGDAISPKTPSTSTGGPAAETDTPAATPDSGHSTATASTQPTAESEAGGGGSSMSPTTHDQTIQTKVENSNGDNGLSTDDHAGTDTVPEAAAGGGGPPPPPPDVGEDTAAWQARLGVEFVHRRSSGVSAASGTSVASSSTTLMDELGVSFDSASASPSPEGLFVEGMALPLAPITTTTTAVAPGDEDGQRGDGDGNESDGNGSVAGSENGGRGTGAYIHVDGVSMASEDSDAEDVVAAVPLRRILRAGSVMGITKSDQNKQDLDTEISNLKTAFPSHAKDKRGHRLSAADSIAAYLTEKRLAANPFASELREYNLQVDMFKLCSESMLEQFVHFVIAEEDAAVAEVEARYENERSKIQRRLKAAEIAQAISPEPETSASGVDFDVGGGGRGRGTEGMTPTPATDAGQGGTAGPAVTALRGHDESNSVTPEAVTTEPATVPLSPASAAVHAALTGLKAEDHERGGGDDAGPAATTAGNTHDTTDSEDIIDLDADFDQTVCVTDMKAARAQYAPETTGKLPDIDADPAHADAVAQAAFSYADAASRHLDEDVDDDDDAADMTVRVTDMAAARAAYGGGGDATEGGSVGGNNEDGVDAAASPIEGGIQEMWDPETGQIIEKTLSPNSRLLRKNRPHTVWHKPGDASPLHSPTGASPVDKDDADGAEVDEDEDATPEPEDNDIIEEDIPEDIASNKKASGWVSDSNPKGGVRKGII